MNTNNGNWDEWRRLVLDKLDTLESGQESMRDQLEGLKTDMAVQKVKSGAWGAVSGAATALIIFLTERFLGRQH